jgi:hypothetical protein
MDKETTRKMIDSVCAWLMDIQRQKGGESKAK